MTIRVRRGLEADLDKNKLTSGETPITIDKGKMYYCVAPGDVRELATKEDVNDLLTAVPELYDKLQMLVGELENETLLQGILGDIDANADNLTAHLAEKASQTNLGHVKLPTEPLNPTLLNGSTFGNPGVKYWKDDFGNGYIEAVISNTGLSQGLALCELPEGFRPSATVLILGQRSNDATYASFILTREGLLIYSGTQTSGVFRINGVFSI